MSHTAKGYVAASLSTLIIGLSFMFVKIALASAGPVTVLADRFTIAFIVMLPIAFIKRKNIFLSRRKMALFFPIALLYPVIFFLMQTLGMNQAITSSEAGVVQSTTPICILLLACIFLKERIGPAQLLFTFLSVSGVLLILFANGVGLSVSHATGLLLILCSVLSGATNNILIRKYRSDFTTLEITFFSAFTGFVIFNALSIFTSYRDNTPYMTFFQSGNVMYTAALLYLGTLSSLASSFLTNYALSKIQASKVGVFNNLVIVVAIFAGFVFMGERLSILQVIGALAIFAGVLGANAFGHK